MMHLYKRIVGFSFLVFAFVQATAQLPTLQVSYVTTLQNADGNLIFYQPKSLLTISDFEGLPKAGSNAVAITSSGFAFNAGITSSAGRTTIVVAVYCTFHKKKSWMKPAGKTAYVLQHEQLHFHISYLAALRFIKALKATQFSSAPINEQLTSLYNKATASLLQMQNQYDAATQHGINTTEQKAWTQKIDAMLIEQQQ
jgi:hypothetical protein